MLSSKMARAATTLDAFNAIAEPKRRAILDELAVGELPVNDLVGRLGMTQPQVSKHLRVLREVGAVDVRSDGRQRIYRINPAALRPVETWLAALTQTWNERFDAIDTVLDDLKRHEGADRHA